MRKDSKTYFPEQAGSGTRYPNPEDILCSTLGHKSQSPEDFCINEEHLDKLRVTGNITQPAENSWPTGVERWSRPWPTGKTERRKTGICFNTARAAKAEKPPKINKESIKNPTNNCIHLGLSSLLPRAEEMKENQAVSKNSGRGGEHQDRVQQSGQCGLRNSRGPNRRHFLYSSGVHLKLEQTLLRGEEHSGAWRMATSKLLRYYSSNCLNRSSFIFMAEFHTAFKLSTTPPPSQIIELEEFKK